MMRVSESSDIFRRGIVGFQNFQYRKSLQINCDRDVNWQDHFNCVKIFGNLHKDSSECYDVVFNVNLLVNGDAETGPCATNKSIVHPTGWNYNGSVTQINYNNTSNTGTTPTMPSPR